MDEEIDFRVITEKEMTTVRYVSVILGNNGFRICDLRETDIVKDSDNSKVQSVYVICCRGNKKDVERFKIRNKIYTEIEYEGIRTLW